MRLIRRRIDTLRGEGGYAMVAVLAVMLISTLAAVAAVNATEADLRPGAADKDRKAAIAAAEAGVNDYLAHLVADVDYWRTCANPQHPALNQRWDGSGTDPRRWRTIDGTTARYALEVLPANGAAQCESGAQAASTFIDNQTATFKIRSTGQARPGGAKRSVVASFRRRGFLDFVYFTDFETFPPELIVTDPTVAGRQTRKSSSNSSTVLDWARGGANNTPGCTKYWRDGRGNETWSGQVRTGSSSWSNVTVDCSEIQFKSNSDGSAADRQRGPFHTNDEILVCYRPFFGENPSDKVEISAPAPGWRQSSGCSGSQPQVNFATTNPIQNDRGTWKTSAEIMTLPPSNQSVADEALPASSFVGQTTIEMNGSSMKVWGKRANGQVLNGVTLDLPVDSVVSVANDGTCGGLDPLKPLAAPPSCGDLWISGTYSGSVTFTAANDIVVKEDVTATSGSDAMLGLIASHWVRVHHTTTNDEGYSCGNNRSDTPKDVRIEAAILAINKSFTVDKYWCGANLGTLSVYGVIAQQFRGPVGRGSSGYTKDYLYDRRLRFRSPPRFLDPVQSSWRVQNQTEQVPAT